MSLSTAGSPPFTYSPFLTIPSPTIRRRPAVAFSRYPSALQVSLRIRLRHLPAGSSPRLTETGSLYYGLVVHLLLLSTPPCGDAVTVGYRPESVCLKWTLTTLFEYPRGRTGRRTPFAEGAVMVDEAACTPAQRALEGPAELSPPLITFARR